MSSQVADPETPSISLILYFPFQFYFYKNIYQALGERAEFVIDLCHDLSPEEDEQLKQSLIALISSINGRYRVLTKDHYETPGAVAHFFAHTKCLVSTWEKGSVVHEATASLLKVRVAYGVAKELTMVRSSGVLYDLVLAHGPRDAANFGLLAPTEIVGLPKFDEWFTESVPPLPKEIEDRLQKDRPTILYAPTHGDLSSIAVVAPQLKELVQSYNVIVRLHYASAQVEQSRQAEPFPAACILVDDNSDILPQLKVADIMISDNSSTIFEAILANRPVLVADIWSDQYLLEQHTEPRAQFGGVQGALTYPDSIEQVVKRTGQVPTFTTTDSIAEKIKEALAKDETYAAYRAELKASLFAHTDGTSGERAARAILHLLTSTEPAKRPIMYYSVKAGSHTKKEADSTRARQLIKENKRLQALLQNNQSAARVHVIVHVTGDSAAWSETLTSLCSQSYPESLYRITIFTSDPKAVEAWYSNLEKLRPLPQISIKPLETNSKQSAWPLVTKTIQASQETYVGIITAPICLDEFWLSEAVAGSEAGLAKFLYGQIVSKTMDEEMVIYKDEAALNATDGQGWWFLGGGLYNRVVWKTDTEEQAFVRLLCQAIKEGRVGVQFELVPIPTLSANYFIRGAVFASVCQLKSPFLSFYKQKRRFTGLSLNTLLNSLRFAAGYYWYQLRAFARQGDGT